MTTDIGTASLKLKLDPSQIASQLTSAVSSAGPAAEKEASKLGKTIGGGLMVGVGAVVAAGGGLFKLGEDFNTATNTIIKGTGQSGLALYGLQKSFQDVYTQTPAGMQDVAGSITTVYQKLGLTGDALSSVDLEIIRLARLTGSDLADATTVVTGLFNQWNVPSTKMVGTLNDLYRASQLTGVGVVDLGTQVTQQAPYFQSLGLSLTDAIGLVGLLGKVGLSTSSITAGFRKEIVTATTAGKPAATAFREVFDQIKHAPTQLKAAQIGLANFGSRGIQVVDLIRSGKLDYGSLVKQIEDTSAGSIDKSASAVSNVSSKFEILKHKLAVDLKPAADAVFNGMGNGLALVSAWFDRNGPKISAFLVGTDGKGGLLAKIGGIPQDIQHWTISGEDQISGHTANGQHGQGIQDFQAGLKQLQTNWPGFWQNFHTGMGVVNADFQRGADLLRTKLGMAGGFDQTKVGFDRFKTDFHAGLGVLGGDVSRAGGQINTYIVQPIYKIDQLGGKALAAVQTGVVNIGKGIASVMTGFAEMDPGKVFHGLVDAWQGAVRDLNLGNLGSMWDGLGAGFTAAINVVISGWDDLVDHLGIHISIPSWIPGIGGKSWDWDAKGMHIDPIGASSGGGKTVSVANGAGRFFHSGGLVPGSYRQDVPATLQAGEYVIPADQVAGILSGASGGASGDVNHFHIHQPSDRATAKEIIRQRRNAAFLAGGR